MYLKDRASRNLNHIWLLIYRFGEIKCIYKVPNIIGLCISNCKIFAPKMLLSTFDLVKAVNNDRKNVKLGISVFKGTNCVAFGRLILQDRILAKYA